MVLVCGKGEFENALEGGPLWPNFFEVWTWLFSGIFFHPTMWEGGIQKCSERGITMGNFFKVIFFSNLLCGKGEFENAPKGVPLWPNFCEI